VPLIKLREEFPPRI